MNTFKILGVAGLILISLAMIVKSRKTRDVFSFFGGVGLLIYSLYIKDVIFIVLQSVYILIILIDFIKQKIK